MKILIAIDSFKGSLSSMEAGNAAAEGIRRVPGLEADIMVRALADGGEGTTTALVEGLGGEYRTLTVTCPSGRPVDAAYGILPDRALAIIEMAAASGITLLSPEERNPLHTTTRGFGEMIRHAIEIDGCRRFILGIGGSATNDGGAGMLQALGFRLLDSNGNDIAPGAAGLETITSIDATDALPLILDGRLDIQVACDVDNPLCGTQGCSAVFGPQKGATPGMVGQMERAMSHYASVVQRAFPDAAPDAPGSGAAGGLGFALRTFLQGKLRPGVEIVLEETGLEEAVRQADVVVTGEGRLDGQTVHGKAPAGIARLAKKHGRPVIAFSGCVSEDARLCNEAGIHAYFPILRSVCSLNDALDKGNAHANLADTAEQVFRLLTLKMQ